ncbi:hypothetical protein, partial [Arthrobacter methylotrophus]
MTGITPPHLGLSWLTFLRLENVRLQTISPSYPGVLTKMLRSLIRAKAHSSDEPFTAPFSKEKQMETVVGTLSKA